MKHKKILLDDIDARLLDKEIIINIEENGFDYQSSITVDRNQ